MTSIFTKAITITVVCIGDGCTEIHTARIHFDETFEVTTVRYAIHSDYGVPTNVAAVIDSDGMLYCAWVSSSSEYPASYNIKYAKGDSVSKLIEEDSTVYRIVSDSNPPSVHDPDEPKYEPLPSDKILMAGRERL